MREVNVYGAKRVFAAGPSIAFAGGVSCARSLLMLGYA